MVVACGRMLVIAFVIVCISIEISHQNEVYIGIMAYAKQNSTDVRKQCVFVQPYGQKFPQYQPSVSELVPVFSVPQSAACEESGNPLNQPLENISVYLYPRPDCVQQQAQRTRAYHAKYIFWTSEKQNVFTSTSPSPPVVLLLKKDLSVIQKVVGESSEWNGTWQMGIYHLYNADRDHDDFSSRYLPTMIVMLLAMCTVSFGAYLGAKFDQDHSFVYPLMESSTLPKWAQCITVVVLMMFMVTNLLLLYFFFDYMVWPIMVIALILFAFATGDIFHDVITRLASLDKSRCRWQFPRAICGKTSVNCLRIGLLIPAVGLAIFYFVNRHAWYSFIFVDILGFLACVYIIKMSQVPTLRILTVLLTGVFVYDIFMVFITPLMMSNGPTVPSSTTTSTDLKQLTNFTSNVVQRIRRLAPEEGRGEGAYDPYKLMESVEQKRKKSVMESVALGTSEQLPLMFKVPSYNIFRAVYEDSVFCVAPTYLYSYLGFGDVILPGFLGRFLWTYDMKQQTRLPWYYLVFIIGYMAGLIMTGVSLFLMKTAQPALLFLVPATLLPTMLLGLARKELRVLWRGPFENESVSLIAGPDGVETLMSSVSEPSTPVKCDDMVVLHVSADGEK